MFDDPDGVTDPVWGDLCQDSGILAHTKNADGHKNVSSTYSVAPSSSSYFHAKLIPDQMISDGPRPKTISNHNRDYDGCSSDGTAKGFNCPSNNISMGEKTAEEFYNSSNVLGCKDSFSLEESYSFSNGGIMEYDSKYGDNQDSSFLDCDWASMTNFDDLDGIFSNYSVLGDREMGKTGEILSPTDSISTKIPPHLVPENTVKAVAGENCSYPFQGSEECQGKMVDKIKMDEDKGHHLSRLSSNNDWISDMDDNEMVYIPSAMLSQQGLVGESKFLDYLPPDQPKTQQYDLAVPSVSPHHVAKKQRHHVSSGYVTDYPCDLKNVSSLPNSGEMLPTVPAMTPLQKIGKLRWHQQMQATLAIKQQQKQLGLQFSGAHLDISHRAVQINRSGSPRSTINCEENIQLPKIKMPVADEVDGISVMGFSQAESALFHLQDTISKLDDNFRACIRDSLFRLARNAFERCNGCDRSSTNTCSRDDDEVSMNAEAASQDSRVRLPNIAGEETETNPIDRIVARMLFNCSTAPFNAPQPSSGLVEHEPSLSQVVSTQHVEDGGNWSRGSARR